MQVYILYDNYTQDEPTIYGVYNSYEVAEEALKLYSSKDNKYGMSFNDDDTMEITEYTVYSTPGI